MTPKIEEILGQVRVRDLPRRRVPRVAPSTTLGEVVRILDREESVAVLVCTGQRLVGIFTERDVLNRTALEGDPATPIGELMTPDPVVLGTDALLAEAIRTMSSKGFRHLPVVDASGEPFGLVGGRDVLRLIAEHYPETLLNLPPRLHQKIETAEGA